MQNLTLPEENGMSTVRTNKSDLPLIMVNDVPTSNRSQLTRNPYQPKSPFRSQYTFGMDTYKTLINSQQTIGLREKPKYVISLLNFQGIIY